MRRYRLGSHSKFDSKVHKVWAPKYRKRVLSGPVAVRTRDLLRQIVMENDLQIISGKAAPDHVHMFLSYRAHQNISQIAQWLKVQTGSSCFRNSRISRSSIGAATSGRGIFCGHFWNDRRRDDQRVHQRTRRQAGRGRQSISNRPLLNPSPYRRALFSFSSFCRSSSRLRGLTPVYGEQ